MTTEVDESQLTNNNRRRNPQLALLLRTSVELPASHRRHEELQLTAHVMEENGRLVIPQTHISKRNKHGTRWHHDICIQVT